MMEQSNGSDWIELRGDALSLDQAFYDALRAAAREEYGVVIGRPDGGKDDATMIDGTFHLISVVRAISSALNGP
jgi:hypothetical protein